MITREQFFKAVEKELDKARTKHGTNQWNRHEFHSILEEEFEEVWADIKANAPTERLLQEVIQMAAVLLHYVETNDRKWGEHPSIGKVLNYGKDHFDPRID